MSGSLRLPVGLLALILALFPPGATAGSCKAPHNVDCYNCKDERGSCEFDSDCKGSEGCTCSETCPQANCGIECGTLVQSSGGGQPNGCSTNVYKNPYSETACLAGKPALGCDTAMCSGVTDADCNHESSKCELKRNVECKASFCETDKNPNCFGRLDATSCSDGYSRHKEFQDCGNGNSNQGRAADPTEVCAYFCTPPGEVANLEGWVGSHDDAAAAGIIGSIIIFCVCCVLPGVAFAGCVYCCYAE